MASTYIHPLDSGSADNVNTLCEDSDVLLGRLLHEYKQAGHPIPVDFRTLLPDLGKTERATHLVHPYPAKLLRHIPYFFLRSERLSNKGDIVADPFCGSGTVLLEAILAERHAVGADSNPFARLLTRVKTTPLDLAPARLRTEELTDAALSAEISPVPAGIDIKRWYFPHAAAQLSDILSAVNAIADTHQREFFQVCFSLTARKVSLADPRLSVPVRLQVDQYPEGHRLRQRTNERIELLRRVTPLDVFKDVVDSNLQRLEALNRIQSLGKVQFVTEDARHVPLESASVQLVLTSPPYGSAQKYIRSSSIALGWLGYFAGSLPVELERRSIGREHYRKADYVQFSPTGIQEADDILKVVFDKNPLRAHIASQYLVEMKDAILESARVLRSGGFLVMVAAPNRIAGLEFPTHIFLDRLVSSANLVKKLQLTNEINARALMTRRNHTAGLIKSESVYLYEKL